MSTQAQNRKYQAFRTAKSIAKNIPASKFALAPKTLLLLERIEFLSKRAGYDLLQLDSVRILLRNSFEREVVKHLRRTLDPSQTAAIATADIAYKGEDPFDE
jgi:hypothetical protein